MKITEFYHEWTQIDTNFKFRILYKLLVFSAAFPLTAGFGITDFPHLGIYAALNVIEDLGGVADADWFFYNWCVFFLGRGEFLEKCFTGASIEALFDA